jgi:hypothetical protein
VLIDVHSGKRINEVPHAGQFDTLRSRLTEAELGAMVDRINGLVDDAGAEIATAGWLPGGDWTGTPFLPTYAKAARQNYDVAARFFGQLVCDTIMRRDETWGFGRYEVDGRDIGSLTYFRVVT